MCVCFYACLHICHQEGAGLAVRVVTCIQTLCDMIRNSIYRCYGIIATIKEVFHLPNDLRLASQDTENDLMAMSFTVQRLRRNACVCMCMTAAVCVCVCLCTVGHFTYSVFRKSSASRTRPSPRWEWGNLARPVSMYIRPSHGWLDAPWVAHCGQYGTGDWTHRMG